MQFWLVLLAGSLAFGACIVGAMVLPRFYATLAVLASIGGFGGALYALGTIAQVYSTPIAIGVAAFVMIAGISVGYAIAASLIPHLAGTPRRAAAAQTGSPTSVAIILLGSVEPDRYDPRVIAHRQNLLAESADIELPLTASPFIFMTEKARYRTIGGRAPGNAVAVALADKVADIWGSGDRPTVTVASDEYPTDLSSVVATQVAAGATQVVIVPLGPPDSAASGHALAALDVGCNGSHVPSTIVAPPIWHDEMLVTGLVDRIMARADDTPPGSIGVVLVCPGASDAQERRYTGSGEVEHYFIQRVRMRLTEADLKGDHVRATWLDWHTLDVTEAVRHLAAIGCERIITVPAAAVLPTLGTLLDLERAVAYARVPASVTTVTLGAWEDDDAVAHAVRSAAVTALGGTTREGSGAS